MSNSPLNSTPHTAPQGRSLSLILVALGLFTVIWWFWPFPNASKPIAQAPTVVSQENLTAPASDMSVIAPTPTTTNVSTESTQNVPAAARKLGPSKGSLLPNPKPRDMMTAADLGKALNLLLRLDPNERLLTALTIEEAEWMDAVGFPTIEEMNSINPDDMQKYHGVKNPSIRGLAIQAAIWKRQGNPRWREPAGLLAAWGCPFGIRLMIQGLMEEPVSVQRDKSLIYFSLLGNLLGDPYKPYQMNFDRRKQWTTWDAMNIDEVLYSLRVQIPNGRAGIGLPPLQVIPLARVYWVTRP